MATLPFTARAALMDDTLLVSLRRYRSREGRDSLEDHTLEAALSIRRALAQRRV